MSTKSPLAQHLLLTYGPRLTMEELALALRVSLQTLRNRVANGTLGVKTYVDGRRRWADYRDVAAYLDAQRAKEEA